jgi:hypothetical protein
MSSLFTRMVDRAAGRSPAVRTATPQLAAAFTPAAASITPPGPVTSELAPATDPVVAAPAAPRLAPAPAAVSEHAPARVGPANAGEPTPVLATQVVVNEPAASRAPARDASSAPVVPIVESTRERALMPAVAPVERVLAPRAGTASTAITEAPSEPPLVSVLDETPLAAKLVAPTPEALVGDATPREAVAAEAERITPRRPRVMRATPALPKLDLRQALDAVGRALAEPPRPRPAPARAEIASDADHEDVHITIGHIDVRATTPAPVGPAQPARRAPSITLAEYLRRSPGSPR